MINPYSPAFGDEANIDLILPSVMGPSDWISDASHFPSTLIPRCLHGRGVFFLFQVLNLFLDVPLFVFLASLSLLYHGPCRDFLRFSADLPH